MRTGGDESRFRLSRSGLIGRHIPPGGTWIESRLPGTQLARPLQKFLHVEAASGIVLLLATAAALAWANSPWSESYQDFWHTAISVEVGDFRIREDLAHWVNDGLMVIFFFVVGLEIKTELVAGELRDRRRAALPAIAALGGMAVPALAFAAVNAGGDGFSGWGIPMATDIAFAVGVLALLGPRVPASLKVFLLTLAIVDDIGAILVIAVFYTEDLSVGWLVLAFGLLGLTVAARLGRVWYIPIYVAIGIALWVATLESGVHATIAGVALGLVTPAAALRTRSDDPPDITPEMSPQEIRQVLFHVRETVPVTVRLQETLHPYSAYVVLPLFALANAGIELSTDALSDAASAPVTVGIVLGLVLGKIAGITGASWLAARSGIGTLPDQVTWPHIVGVSSLAGIGFTVAIFITGLAFTDPVLQDEAKIGILVASFVAAVAGAVILRRAVSRQPEPELPAAD